MRYPSKLVMRVRFPLPAPKVSINQLIPQKISPKNNNNTMKTTSRIALVATALCSAVIASTTPVDTSVVAVIKSDLSQNKQTLLQTVTSHVSANPELACEIVKTVVRESKCDVATVASIVETAALAAPDQIRMIAQCAVAVAPDSFVEVQQVIAKLDASGQDDEVASVDGNPLNFPTGEGGSGLAIAGPTTSAPGDGDGGGDSGNATTGNTLVPAINGAAIGLPNGVPATNIQ
jgi:hypothetical protein